MFSCRSLSLLATVSLLVTTGGFGATTATNPVGYVSYAFGSGTQLVGFPLLNAAILEGNVTQVAGNVLSLEGSDLEVGRLLAGGKSYFVEITADPNGIFEGDRLDVDTASTLADGSAHLTIRPSEENTIQGPLPSGLAGCRLVLREHLTLGQLAEKLPGAFQAGDALVKAVDGGALATFVFDGTSWRSSFANQDGELVRPGAGVMLVRETAATTTGRLTGDVRTNDFLQPIKAGGQLLAEGYPVDCAPKPLSATSANRLFTNDQGTTFEAGATLVAQDPSTGSLSIYRYATDSNTWNTASFTQNNTCLFQDTKAVFLTTEKAIPDYVQLRPFAL